MTPEKILSNHLNISEEKALHLLDDLEKVSWIYSSSSMKRMIGIWGNLVAANIMIILPFICMGIISDLFF